MKKIFLVLFVMFLLTNGVNAESNFESDYTLIDCIEGSDDTGLAFDSIKPYQTLKGGIEGTINYINSNINVSGNEETASGKILTIKVKCSVSNMLDSIINLGFKGAGFNNELLIEGIGDNGLIIQKTKFKILKGAGNIIFKNAKFENEYNDYFEDEVFDTVNGTIHPSSYGITILDSFIKLNNNINLGENNNYQNKYSFSYNYAYNNYSNYTNKQKILNSQIDIEVDGNYDFKMPFYLKDSKINFVNKSGTGVYNINFVEESNANNFPKVDYSVFVSNEINIGGHNLSVENDSDIGFINNKIGNFKNLNLGGGALYFNNTFENTLDVDISSTHYLLNSIFKSTFTDTFDEYNLRKNYANNEAGEKGIGWIFKRKNNVDFFNIDLSSTKLYKEITGIDIEGLYNSIYVIFTK